MGDNEILYGTVRLLSSLVNLKVFRIKMGSGPSRYDTPPLGVLSRLRDLTIIGVDVPVAKFPSFFAFLEHLPMFQKFTYRGYDAVSSTSDHISCSTLESLHLHSEGGVDGSTELPIQLIRRKQGLVALGITTRSRNLADMSFGALSELPHLEELSLRSSAHSVCIHPGYWDSFMRLTHLCVLHVEKIRMPDLTVLRAMTQLRELVYNGWDLESLDGVDALECLQVLEIPQANVVDITGLRVLTRLRRLVLSDKVDCEPVALGELPCLVALMHPTRNCLRIHHACA